MKRKYFFFDIDGTLAVGQPGRQYIPESTKYTLEKLKEAGHFVAIATGRSYAMAKEMMEMTKNNILQQAAQSMLAQANQNPQNVLQLLR
jgi:HAD superfamily hydrolase (TIGR01484 family)